MALAGIMGGANSGMDENTTSLLFECATFARDCVRKTSRALGQNSDSSARYEKGVDRHFSRAGPGPCPAPDPGAGLRRYHHARV